MSGKPYLIGIAGASCSGKTLLAKRLAALLGNDVTTVLPLDSYYRDLSHLDAVERARWNFDVPAALDETLLLQQIETLLRGEPIDVPEYDFSTHTRTTRTHRLRPGDYVILEGLFVLYWEAIRATLNLRVFIEAADRVCLERRTDRDVRERGRTEESVHHQYAETVRPMYDQYCAPTQQFADVVLNGEDPIEASAAAVLERIRLARAVYSEI